MRILGVDPGLATVGWAIVEKNKDNSTKLTIVGAGSIDTKPSTSFPKRLSQIYDSLGEIIEQYGPAVMAIESLFFFKNKKTVISVSQARGVAVLAAQKNNITVFDYTPLQVKTALTGFGRADKVQIQKTVKMIYKLKEVPKPDDVADAIAVATCHINTF